MIDRQSLRDIGLAVLLALPTATLARPSATMLQVRTTAVAQVQTAHPLLDSSRAGLPR